MRILVIEDEPKMVQMLRDGLREHGHTVMTAGDGVDGLRLSRESGFEVILLDMLLPKMTGWEVLRKLKQDQNPSSILILTACDAETEVIAGLDEGADDYLTKPFSFLELLARIKSLARSQAAPVGHRVSVDSLVLDRDQHQAYRAGRSLDLTRTEMALLDRLLKSAGQTVTRAALVHTVWGANAAISRGTLDSFMNLLRKKVDLPGEPKLLHTIKGTGYSIRKDSVSES